MKKFLSILALFISCCATAQLEQVLPAKPSPPRLVNDLTGNFLQLEQVAALEQKLRAYDDSTSNQIAIVIVKSLDGNSPNDYATALGRKWQVGNKEFNNGIVILIAPSDIPGQSKVAIAVGYGLEKAVPDLTTKAIIDNSLIPNFKSKNNYRALDHAVDDLMHAAAGEYKAPKGYGSKGINKGLGFGAIVLFLITIFIFGSIGGRGGGGGMVSRRGYGDIGAGWILGSLLGGMGRGSGGGGGWSGGGGGGGGGGFGGFGGGSFGGGGSSGSW
jgi:uncharacterized protein